jgi:hypothetical protein
MQQQRIGKSLHAFFLYLLLFIRFWNWVINDSNTLSVFVEEDDDDNFIVVLLVMAMGPSILSIKFSHLNDEYVDKNTHSTLKGWVKL